MGYTKTTGVEVGASRIREIRRVLWTILFLNLGVALSKLAYGTYIHSAAMQADGFHSLFDGTSNVVGLVGMGLAARPADHDHPYGHSKYETYASAAIGAMLLFAAYRIGSSAVQQLTGEAVAPNVTAASFAIMIITLCINVFITTYERRVGKRLGSEILVADASHTASDILVSLGVLLSLALVKIGEVTGNDLLLKADPIVAGLVAIAIVYTAWGVFKQASATLSDSARIPVADICAVTMSVAGVLGCHHVRTRGSEAEVYVDLHVQVDETRTVADGHRIAEDVERTIATEFPQVVDVIAHLEPYDEYQASKTQAELDARTS